MVLEQLRKKTLKTVHINTCVSYRLFVLDKIRPENCFDSEQFGMISSVFRFNEWHLDQQRKLGKEEKYLFFCPGSAAGAAALKSGDAVRWWLLSIALATRGRAGAADPPRPSPKILQPAGVFTFLGVRGGRKEGKICRCVLEVLVERFLVDFWSIFYNFLVLSTRKNRVIYNVFVPLASKKSF